MEAVDVVMGNQQLRDRPHIMYGELVAFGQEVDQEMVDPQQNDSEGTRLPRILGNTFAIFDVHPHLRVDEPTDMPHKHEYIIQQLPLLQLLSPLQVSQQPIKLLLILLQTRYIHTQGHQFSNAIPYK